MSIDKHYPAVSAAFLTYLIHEHALIDHQFKHNESHVYVLKGKKPIAKRTIIFRVLEGEVPLDFAMGIAIKLKCVSSLMEWLETNKNWKEGAFKVIINSEYQGGEIKSS